MQVLKFGGSSVANATNISRVLDIITNAASEDRVIAVFSAIGGCTDTLIEIGKTQPGCPERKELAKPLLDRHVNIIKRLFTGNERDEAIAECKATFDSLIDAPCDETVTYGELLSSKLLARKFACDGIETVWLDSRELVIKDHIDLTYSNISAAVAKNPGARIFVSPGFIAGDLQGRRVTLGRGGSDYSAALYAAAINADKLEIWTDVPGMMTANPKTVPLARTIPSMSYQAALDMANNGAKVLYAPTVKPAMEAGLAINIRNTFDPTNPGTIITSPEIGCQLGWTGVANVDDKASGESRICLVGDTPLTDDSACTRIEECLAEAGVAPLSISQEGTNIFVCVRTSVCNATMSAMHREFFETVPSSRINLFIAGYGAVGKAFVEMIAESSRRITKRSGKVLRIVGLGNSSQYVIDQEGINPQEAAEKLASGKLYHSDEYILDIIRSAPRRSIFVDLTDSESIHNSFVDLLRAGINIVTSNRRSVAIPFVEYAAMKAAARENGVFLRYDTTVGSALPMLGSISLSANSSDEILSIEAVVSCALNQIYSTYDLFPGTFADRVRMAQKDSLTEKDPRIDLAGTDALRKLLILAREAGVPLEKEDVEITPVIDIDTPLDRLYSTLEAMEPQFAAAEDKADATDTHQRFVASLVKDPSAPHGYKATVRTRFVNMNHPAYRLTGTENAIIIRSAFHPYPLLIQGPGEGAGQAAGSVLNDILR